MRFHFNSNLPIKNELNLEDGARLFEVELDDVGDDEGEGDVHHGQRVPERRMEEAVVGQHNYLG